MTPRAALDWSLAALAFAAPLSVAGCNAALGLLTAAALWAWSDRGPRAELRAGLDEARRSPVFLLLAAGFAWYLVACAFSDEPSLSLRVMPKELHKLWVFALLSAVFASARRGPALGGLAAGLAVHALVGLRQSLTHGPEDLFLVRARGFVHPVSFGDLMALGFLCAAAHLARAPASDRGRRPAAALAALLGAAVILNQTRATAAALAAALLAVLLLDARSRRALVPAGLALAAVLAFWEFIPTGGRNLRTLFSNDPRASGHRTRFLLWDGALTMARQDPLTGAGPARFRDAFARLHPEPIDPERSSGSAHNLYLHLLAERGVPGLLLLLALFGALAREAWRAARRRADPPALAALAATAAFAVMNLTENAWLTEQVATFFLLVWLWGAGPRPRGEVL